MRTANRTKALWRVTLCAAWGISLLACNDSVTDVTTATSGGGQAAASTSSSGGGGEGGMANPPLEVGDTVPMFGALDVNTTSPTFDTEVSPSDFGGQVSAWYFGHAT